VLRYLTPSQVEECLNWWESGVKSRQEFQCLTCTDINGNTGPWGEIADLGLYAIPVNESGLLLHMCSSTLLFFPEQGLSLWIFHHFSQFCPSKVGVNIFCSKLMLGRSCLPEK